MRVLSIKKSACQNEENTHTHTHRNTYNKNLRGVSNNVRSGERHMTFHK